MPTVIFSSELQKFTGEDKTYVNCANYRSLVDNLTTKYPLLEREKLLAMAISIDDLIVVDPLLEPIADTAEVHFFNFVTGG